MSATLTTTEREAAFERLAPACCAVEEIVGDVTAMRPTREQLRQAIHDGYAALGLDPMADPDEDLEVFALFNRSNAIEQEILRDLARSCGVRLEDPRPDPDPDPAPSPPAPRPPHLVAFDLVALDEREET